jgi:hypothetical protein
MSPYQLSNEVLADSSPDWRTWRNENQGLMALFSASISSSTIVRRWKSGSTNRPRTRPSRSTTSVAGISNVRFRAKASHGQRWRIALNGAPAAWMMNRILVMKEWCEISPFYSTSL